jgi:hypothetical protein
MALSKTKRLALATYASDPNISLEDAIVKAGGSAKRAKITAAEYKRDPEFLQAVERKQANALAKLERKDLTDADVINAIRDIDAEAALVGAVAGFLDIRLKCQNLLAKIRGMLVEKLEFGLDEKLIQAIEQGRKRAFLPEAETVTDH